MSWTTPPLSTVWAQAASTAVTLTPASANPSALAPLALRRWCASITLSSPESVPSLFGLWVWLAGLAGLLALAAVFQGPLIALGQLLDVPGHVRLAAAAGRRLKRSAGMLAVVIGLTVLSWTGSQSFAYRKPEGRDDVLMLTRARHPAELAFEQGVLAALTPLRDLAGLGSNVPLLIVASLVMFRASAEVWGGVSPPWVRGRRELPPWSANTAWVAGGLFVVYRLVSLGTGNTDLPPGNRVSIEALVVPAVMAICDGALLGWVLAELRGTGFENTEFGLPDARAAAELLPASIVSCVAALPARYLSVAVLLGSVYLPASWLSGSAGTYARWQLGQGLTVVQGVALLTAGLAGAAAWTSGSGRDAVVGYARLLTAQGGRVVASITLAGLAAGLVSAAAYLAVLSLPAAPWVLNAADGYAHYGTLPIGLFLLSALVELGERSLPAADLGTPGAD